MAEARAPPPMARGTDRISDLPEGVLHHILSLLPARDAVRTCVLAQSWRNRWRSAPAVRFACSTSLAGHVDTFVPFVDGLLRVRRTGPPLDSCYFDLDLDLQFCDFDLDLQGNSWIGRVLELKVRELRFRLFNPWYHFTLQSRPLSSQHLTSLALARVEGNNAVLDFSGCPALESLEMVASHVWSTEVHSPSLKHLSIKYCCFYSNCRTGMSFPSLISFQFINNSGKAPMLERMPYLETAKVGFGHRSDDRCKNRRLDDCGDAACWGCSNYYGPDGSGCVFLQGLAEATYLNLSAYPDLYVFSRDLEWCPAFNKIKTLVLSKWFLSTDLSALIWFLHHTPLLEKLTLSITKAHRT